MNRYGFHEISSKKNGIVFHIVIAKCVSDLTRLVSTSLSSENGVNIRYLSFESR